MTATWTRTGAAVLALLARAASADTQCHDMSTADCHLAAGQALLQSNPKEAARELLASYQAENRTSTYALYGLALENDHRFATAATVWRRVRTRLNTELDAAKAAQTQAQASGDAAKIADATSAVEKVQIQINNADTRITGLQSLTAQVHLRFAGSTSLVVTRKNEGDIRDPFTETIVVNADDDELDITYADGKSVAIPVHVAGGGEQTVIVPLQSGGEPPKVEPKQADQPLPPPVVHTVQPQPDVVAPASTSHTGRWVGIGVAAGGVLALGGALVFQLQSNSDWNSAQSNGCNSDNVCVRGTPGAASAQQSKDRASLALDTSLVGGALLAVGISLMVLDPHGSSDSTPRLVIEPERGGAAAVFSERF